MINKLKTIGLLLVLVVGQIAYGQSNKDKALEKGNQAIELENDGKIDEAIALLKEAQKLEPTNITYPYELAYAYYAKKDYTQARKYLEETLTNKGVNDRFYQLLGNCYDNSGNSDKAVETYEAGLEKFPNSGKLYLEMGVMQMEKEDYNKALTYFEQDIEVDPEFPSNYY